MADSTEWARDAALRLIGASMGPDPVAETRRVLDDVDSERLASLVLCLVGITGDSLGQLVKAKGWDWDDYLTELEEHLVLIEEFAVMEQSQSATG